LVAGKTLLFIAATMIGVWRKAQQAPQGQKGGPPPPPHQTIEADPRQKTSYVVTGEGAGRETVGVRIPRTRRL